jgi:hypothetical protein
VQLYLAVTIQRWEAEGRGTVWTEKDAIVMESFRVGPVTAEEVLEAAAEKTYS